jgi:hypothetical protein
VTTIAILLLAAWPAADLRAATLAPLDTRLATSPGDQIGPPPVYSVDRAWGTPVAVSGSYTNAFGHSFTAAETALIPITTSFPSGGYSFYDNYFFSVGPSVANSSTTTIRLSTDADPDPEIGIEQLEARLYRVGDPGATQGTLFYGAVPGGAYQAWTLITGPAETALIEAAALSEGTWTLEIRGRVLEQGGSYGGNLNISPVPLPAAAWLMIGALGLLGVGARPRRRNAIAAA